METKHQAAASVVPTPTFHDYGTRANWLAGRRQRIGASEVAILFGVAPKSWGNPYTLWLKKTGRAVESDDDRSQEELDWLDFGNELEPVIARAYEKRTKRALWHGGRHVVALDPECKYLAATPDRIVVDAPGMEGNGVLQIKNAGFYMMRDWDDEVPQHVQIQVQTEIGCTGLRWGSAAVLIGGNTFRSYDLPRNSPAIDEIRATVTDFFERYVIPDRAPPVDGSDETTRALKKLYPLDNGDEVMLPAEAAVWVHEWRDAKDALAAVRKIEEKRADEAENRLRERIGSATFGVLPDGRRLSLRVTARKGYEVKPTTYRTLRLEK